MGFGTLFIGYFLLLNITNYSASDALAGLIMLLGLIKLSGVNRRFVYAKWSAAAFTCFGLFEFAAFFLGMLIPRVDAFYDGIYSYLAAARYLLLAALTVFILQGIEAVAREVELEKIPRRARALSVASLIVYALWMLLELPLGEWMPAPVQAVLYMVAIISLLLLLLVNLVTIYGCYMRICMPGEENGKKQKPSRFKFVNEYREKRAEKEREEEEYRRELLRKKAEKRRKHK